MNTDQYEYIEEDYGEYHISDNRITVESIQEAVDIHERNEDELARF